MKTLKLTFFEDAGHGWLRVPQKILNTLNIEISKCSYMNFRYAYLEEDMDYSTFMQAVKGIYEVETKTKYAEVASCRGFSTYDRAHAGYKIGDVLKLYTGHDVTLTAVKNGYLYVKYQHGAVARIKQNTFVECLD